MNDRRRALAEAIVTSSHRCNIVFGDNTHQAVCSNPACDWRSGWHSSESLRALELGWDHALIPDVDLEQQ